MTMKLFRRNAVVAVLMALLLVLGSLLSACGKKDPVKHMQYVEEKAVEEFAEDLANILDEYNKVGSKFDNGSVSSEIDVDISEAALSMLEIMASASGAEIDLSWLSNIGLDMEGYIGSELVAYNLTLGLGESDLIGLDLMTDVETMTVYAGIPELVKKYLAIDVDAALSSDPSLDLDDSLFSQFQTLIQPQPLFSMATPDGEVLEKLINKYMGIVIGGLKRVERTEGTAIANGVEAACDVLKVTVTEADAIAIAENVLTEVKGDKDFKEMFVALADPYIAYMNSLGGIPATEFQSGEEVYKGLCALIDDTLVTLAEEKAEIADVTEEEALSKAVILETYVNKKDEIIGRRISAEGEELFSYFYVENKKDFSLELSVEGEQLLRGNGTTGKKLNGTFTLVPQGGEDSLVLTVKDLDLDLLEDGYINGTFDIDAAAIAENCDDDTVSAILENYTIRLVCEQGDGSTGKFALSLLDANGADFVKITVASKLGKGKAPSLPAAENVITISPEMDEAQAEQLGMELLTSIDVEAIKDRLNSSPIPKEYVQLIEQYLAYIDMLVAHP